SSVQTFFGFLAFAASGLAAAAESGWAGDCAGGGSFAGSCDPDCARAPEVAAQHNASKSAVPVSCRNIELNIHVNVDLNIEDTSAGDASSLGAAKWLVDGTCPSRQRAAHTENGGLAKLPWFDALFARFIQQRVDFHLQPFLLRLQPFDLLADGLVV